MASDIDRTIASALRFVAVVQYSLHFIRTYRDIGFCNIECQMSNVGRNLTHVRKTPFHLSCVLFSERRSRSCCMEDRRDNWEGMSESGVNRFVMYPRTSCTLTSTACTSRCAIRSQRNCRKTGIKPIMVTRLDVKNSSRCC